MKPVYIQSERRREFMGHASTARGALRIARKYRKGVKAVSTANDGSFYGIDNG